MALLFEMADYSLKSLTEVPQEVSCTSQARKWGISGESDSFKEPIMSKVIWKYINKKGVNPILYDPRSSFDNIDLVVNLEHWKLHWESKKHELHFHTASPVQERELTKSMFGDFYFGSPLSYHLQAVDFRIKVLSNIKMSMRFHLVAKWDKF